MAVALKQWLDLIDTEYLRDFIVKGGATVKFVIADESTIDTAQKALTELASSHGLMCSYVNGAEVKLHMMHELFFEVSRQINWESDAQCVVERLFEQNRYEWPSPGEPMPMKEIAEANQTDVTFLERDFKKWLTSELMKDANMAQDFRLAVTKLCLSRLATPEQGGDSVSPILQWLRGELRLLGPLTSASIFSKITRHNARAMLRSLCRWLVLAGHSGLFFALDIRDLARTEPEVDGKRPISPNAVMDAYEVLRQLIDGADLCERFFVAVFANHEFIGDDHKRGINAYTALKMRIWDDVRAQSQSNPLAPLVVIGNKVE